MANMTDYAEVLVRQFFFRTGTPTKPPALHVGLFTAAPGETGGGTEVTGGSYARVQRDPADANWSGASGSNGLTDNVAAIDFPVPTAAWGTVVAVGIFDAGSGGNLLFYGTLVANRVIGIGEQASFAAGDLDIIFA